MASKSDKLPRPRSNMRGRQVSSCSIWAVILVGGKGKRLRPLSNAKRPKAFLSVTGDKKTMFRKTLDRARMMIPDNNIIVVANAAHAKLVKADFPGIRKENLLLEPAARNTAPAIALAAFTIRQRCGDAVMMVLPADQYIVNEGRYLGSVKDAACFVRMNKKAIVAMGVKPGFPSIHFGYIKVRGPEIMVQNVHKVTSFTEKPDLERAEKYIKDKRYFWNAGAFFFWAGTILQAFKDHAPSIYNGLSALETDSRTYRKLPDISIDYAIMEKAKEIYCVTGKYEWRDMGSFEALACILKREGRRFISKNGKIAKIL